MAKTPLKPDDIETDTSIEEVADIVETKAPEITPVDEIMDRFLSGFRNSVISQNTEVYNALFKGVQDVKQELNSLFEKGK